MRHRARAAAPLTRRAVLAMSLAIPGLAAALPAAAAPALDALNLLIPGGAGGDWDGFARATGAALASSGLVGSVGYTNLPGNGGGTAIREMNGRARPDRVMIAATAFSIRAATGRFGGGFDALAPVAALTCDPAAFVTLSGRGATGMAALLAAFDADPLAFSVGGTTPPGGFDHLAAAGVMEATGRDPLALRYRPFGARGKAMAALLDGRIAALCTGLTAARRLAATGEFRIVGVAAASRAPADPAAPTLIEQGIDATFHDWRGVLAPPGLPQPDLDRLTDIFTRLAIGSDWRQTSARNGWIGCAMSGDAFGALLDRQQSDFAPLLARLGFR